MCSKPFKVFGRLIPIFENGKWTWTEELFETSYEKQYPDDEMDYCEYIDNPDKIVFMAYLDNRCAGQIKVRRNWNKYCYIEDIAVGKEYRGKGVGRKLVTAAIQVDELADLVEVIFAILKYKGVTINDFEDIRRKKAAERGAFDRRLLLKVVIEE